MPQTDGSRCLSNGYVTIPADPVDSCPLLSSSMQRITADGQQTDTLLLHGHCAASLLFALPMRGLEMWLNWNLYPSRLAICTTDFVVSCGELWQMTYPRGGHTASAHSHPEMQKAEQGRLQERRRLTLCSFMEATMVWLLGWMAHSRTSPSPPPLTMCWLSPRPLMAVTP